MNDEAKRAIAAYLSAARRMIEPHRPASGSSPVVISGGLPLPPEGLVEMVRTSSSFDADLLHFEFEEGREAEGPVNILVAFVRGRMCYPGHHCSLWRGEDDSVVLIIHGPSPGFSTFNEDGMDFTPGVFAHDVEAGTERANEKLRTIVADILDQQPSQEAA